MSNFIETSRTIQKRKKANDVFITPLEVAKKHIDMIDYDESDIWLDPCCYCSETGSYISQFPNNVNKEWCEISKGVDFFEYEGKPQHICSNPPYSILDIWLKKCIELQPITISFLIGIGNLTTKRIEIMSKAGYEIEKMNMMKIYDWYGMSVAVVFRKGAIPIIQYDRKVYRNTKKVAKQCIDCKKDISFCRTIDSIDYCLKCAVKYEKVVEEEEEDEDEQCVGLYDGKCYGKKNYKTEELDLGMCKVCLELSEEEEASAALPPQTKGKKKHKFKVKTDEAKL